MNLKFEWQPEEWREALLLASAGPRRPPKPLMTYGVLCMMALGGLGEVASTVRRSSRVDGGISLAPTLLFVAGLVVCAKVYTVVVRRRRKRKPFPPMPAGEQHLHLSEDGWRAAHVRAMKDAPMRPWQDLQEQRTGKRSMIMVGQNRAFAALPLRVLQGEKGGYVNRLLTRKIYRVK